jgi:hypothetical protein
MNSVTNFPFKDPIERRTVERDELAAMLRAFEDEWATTHGERMTSAQFYDRYRTGELDSMFTMSWASYYEIFRRLGENEADTEIVRSLTTC